MLIMYVGRNHRVHEKWIVFRSVHEIVWKSKWNYTHLALNSPFDCHSVDFFLWWNSEHGQPNVMRK